MEAGGSFSSFLQRVVDTWRDFTGSPSGGRAAKEADVAPSPRSGSRSYVQEFQSERDFARLLHEGDPVVVAFTIACAHTKVLDKALEDAAKEFDGLIKFMRVECPKYPGFCISRQRRDYPFVEIFHSPKQSQREHMKGAGQQGQGSVTTFSVNVLPYTYDWSAYGFREFFRKSAAVGACSLNFLDDQDIEMVRPAGWDDQANNPASPISEEEVLSALQIILLPQNYPLHVMCNLGRHRTGTVIGCLRKLQRWNLTAIFEEYRRYAGSKVRLLNEQFIELFDTDLVTIPVEHPLWL
ncbi:hypothetical protein CBR_g19745 [Chara braunii]|uniref:Tyrosine specific protein phosphatases domain-containing protein n=1 Tax=Chara braunii TaxID=69332 RepID=A0A388JU28_CHABU|nr:hypothetical protein CBR_g19745 [Chara braunii]|eukprot:GBG61212.1 hypothetical protein CBR_g19745 [Chara braunii]